MTDAADKLDELSNISTPSGESEMEIREDEHHHYEIGEEAEEIKDYSGLSKEALVELAEKAAKADDVREAQQTFKAIRPVFEHLVHDEQQAALQRFIEEGNDKEDFQVRPDELKTRFQNAFTQFQEKRNRERERLESDKIKNLHAKRDILDKIKALSEADENEDSLNQFKTLQAEWKKIRVIPKENVQELWDSYRFYVDRFYDNLSINHELKDLDRKKNLEFKIELCKKVDELKNEPSVKKALIMLNKYHEDWRNIGPVPKEFNDELWSRFKATSDEVYNQKKALLQEMESKREQNLQLKTVICEKVEAMVNSDITRAKDWVEKTRELQGLFEEWKKTGPVPKAQNDTIWQRFRELNNQFYKQKNNFFKALNKEKAANLKAKEELCERAEKLKDSSDYNQTANELKKLQEEWKKTGPVPDKVSDKIWKRFRAACDEFFNRRDEAMKGRIEEENKNLELKNAVCEKAEAMLGQESLENALDDIRALQAEWNKIGYVPIKHKNTVSKRYQKVMDELFKKFKVGREEVNQSKLKEHYQMISQMPDAMNKFRFEERKVQEKIRFLKNEMTTLQTNIEFFARSKSADGLRKQIQEKIDKAAEQVAKLEKELKLIRSTATEATKG